MPASPLHDPIASPLPAAATETRNTTCYMCACRCDIRVHLRQGPKGPEVERWFFFAQANHPQNLYYQVVS